MNERHLKETIQRQADKIKELEADWLDEYTKCQLIGKELTKLNRIINFIQRGMEGNEQFEQVINDLKGYE
jgi:tRNA-dihydrouridine synthase